ncbi:hypothetical protein F0L68_38525 [Solihabitans fulvus]|uniref:Uncharacterized protein n=1 Tax=Solihabitans fulvus TaxID=1892852 RepID=A0A5B2WJA3_9PSEU|nr:hypothetical protein [Solihabitans fulvus]KAA2250988.1 hypothetical protein F0L68_38525 [Solihabitans fulvus]
MRYDRRAFAEAHLDAHADNKRGHYSEKHDYNVALMAYRKEMLSGLQRLFGLTVNWPPETGSGGDAAARALFDLSSIFDSTVRSCVAITSPLAGHLEAGLFFRRLEQSGEHGRVVLAGFERITDLGAQLREAHVDILTSLLAIMLGDRADLVFTTADLRAIGVDDTEPDSIDYPWDFDDE